jgi:hypothetical protein
MERPSQPLVEDDARFKDDVDQVLSHANPNPERIGCPSRESLIALARRVAPIGDPGWEHLVKCSPCYREFRALQREQAEAPVVQAANSRGLWIAVAAVAVLVAGAAGIWFVFGSGDRSGDRPASVSQPQVSELRTELDLRKFAVTRSERGTDQGAPVLLPIGLVDLTLLMPVGSEPGNYEIQVLDANLQWKASARGLGQIRDFVTTIQTKIDLRSVPSGTYQLAVRREGDDWRFFPARVQ